MSIGNYRSGQVDRDLPEEARDILIWGEIYANEVNSTFTIEWET